MPPHRDMALWCVCDSPAVVVRPGRWPNPRVWKRCSDSEAGRAFVAALVAAAYREWMSVPAVTATCAVCGRELDGRSDAVYCSNACRQRAYRERTVGSSGGTR